MELEILGLPKQNYLIREGLKIMEKSLVAGYVWVSFHSFSFPALEIKRPEMQRKCFSLSSFYNPIIYARDGYSEKRRELLEMSRTPCFS